MNTVFGKRFQKLRNQNNETQLELAEQFKVSRGMISHWENGRFYPEITKVIEIAEYFDVTTDYLLGLSDEWRNETQPAAKTPANTLTEDEREVIDMYRRITPREKQKVKIALEMYADTEDAVREKGL